MSYKIKPIFSLFIACFLCLFCSACGTSDVSMGQVIEQMLPEEPPLDLEMISLALEEGREFSSAPTYYEGITKVTNPKDMKDILYYISYEALYTTAVDFDNIVLEVDDIAKILYVTLPSSRVTKVDINQDNLDYLIYGKDIYPQVTKEADVKLCTEDAWRKSLELVQMKQQVTNNSKQAIESICLPFLKQFRNPYTLEFVDA